MPSKPGGAVALFLLSRTGETQSVHPFLPILLLAFLILVNAFFRE